MKMKPELKEEFDKVSVLKTHLLIVELV